MQIRYAVTSTEYRLNYVIEHCIIAVAFFLPLSLNVTSIFLALGAVFWLAKMVVTRRLGFRRTPFDALVVALVFLSAISIYASPDRGFSFYNYYNLMGRYILIYYLVINNIHSLDQLRRVVGAVLASSVLVAAYGFYQYIHGVDISAFEWVDGEQFPELKVRVFSTLENPNLLAGFLVIIMALAAGLGLNYRQTRNKVLCLGLILALGACLVLTYSRGAWISIMTIIFAYGIIYNKRVLWLLVLLPIGAVVGHEMVMERLMSIMNPTDTSATLRLALWESTLAMIMDKPLTGIGWGAYWMVYPHYDFFIQDPGTKIFHAHNMYLNIAAEIGIPGFITFMAIMYGHVRLARNLARSVQSQWLAGLMLGILGAMLGIAVSGFTDYILFNIQMSMLFWLLCALIVVADLENYRIN